MLIFQLRLKLDRCWSVNDEAINLFQFSSCSVWWPLLQLTTSRVHVQMRWWWIPASSIRREREWEIRERINLMNEMNPSSMRTIKNSKFHSLTWASRLFRIPSERVPTSTWKALGKEGNKKCFIDFWPRHGGTRAIVRDSSKSFFRENFFVHVNYVYKAHWWNARLKSELDITHFHTYTWWSRAQTHGALMRWSSGHSCLFSRFSCATFR